MSKRLTAMKVSPIKRAADDSDYELESDEELDLDDEEQDDRESSDDLSGLNKDFKNKSVLEDEDFSLGDWINRTSNSLETSSMMEKLDLSTESSVIWAADLDLKHNDSSFNETTIPADAIHVQLSSSGNKLKNLVGSKLPPSQIDAKHDPKANFLMVNIGYVLSKPAKNGSKFVSFPMRVMGENFYSVQSSWEDDKKSKTEAAESINERSIHGWNHTPQQTGFTKVQENGPSHYYGDAARRATYDSSFHHSEQALYEYLIKDRVIKSLLERLNQAGVEPGTDIHGIVIDMHSTRYVCENCELGGLGMMSSEYGFLQSFAQKAQEYGYNYRYDADEIAMRVTANRPKGRSGKISASSHVMSPESRLIGHRAEDMRNRTIYQRDIDIKPLATEESDLHRRSSFISSHVADNKNYTDSYDQIVVGEYTAMIAKGKAMRATREFQSDEMENEDGVKLAGEDLEVFEEVVTIASRRDALVQRDARQLHSTRMTYEKDIKKGGDGTGR